MKTDLSRLLLFFMVLLLHLSAQQVSIDNAPRIIADNGNIIFRTALKKSIQFETLKGGQIQLNDIDLGALSNEIKAMKNTYEEIKNLKNCNCELMKTKLEDNNREINELKTSVTSSDSTISNLINTIDVLKEKLIADDCANNPCHNGGKCVDLYNDYKCLCTERFKGRNCLDDVDECTQLAGTDLGCQNGASCQNIIGGFRCQCVGKYTGILCNLPLNGCLGSSNTELCGHGTCIADHTNNNPRSYKCICEHGWSLDSITQTCINDVDECQIGRFPCSLNPSVECINTPGQFSCGPCPSGFDGNGFQCRDIDECATSNICGVNENCINSFGSYLCQCIQGMRRGSNGLCQSENICEINNGQCSPNAICTRNPSRLEGRDCQCPIGYTGNAIGLNGCVLDIPSNITNARYRRCVRRRSCRNGGTCQLTTNGFVCQCAPGFSGRRCRVAEQNQCLQNPCLNEGHCEFLPPRQYRCICKPFFTGVNCENEHSECGGTFINPRENQEISLMINPSTSSLRTYRYPCVWKFIVSTEQFIHIIPTSLQLRGPCSEEYVTLYERFRFDDNSVLLGKYCQDSNSEMKRFNTTGSILIVKASLKRGLSQTHGFTLTIVPKNIHIENSDCCRCLNYEFDKTNITNGIFESPHFPLKYPNNFACSMEFERTIGETYKIKLLIGTLNLGDKLNNCTDTDFIEIHFVDDGIIKLTACNQENYNYVTYITSGFLIQFRSDSRTDVQSSRFKFRWEKSFDQDPCGGIISLSPVGTIIVPALTLELSVYCTWKIQHTNTSKLILFKGYFNNWVNGDCSIYLKINNIDNNGTNTVVYKTCQTETMLQELRDQIDGDLIITFMKSVGVSSPSFRLTIEYVCGQSIDMDQLSTYQFQSDNYPNNYDSNSYCEYKFKSTTRKIEVIFDDVDINDDYPCNSDYLEMKNTNSMNLNKRYCNGNLDELTPLNKGKYQDYIILVFKSNESISGRGFRASVRAFECGGSFFLKNKLNIRYPEINYEEPMSPENYVYGHNKNCTWNIYARPSDYIIMMFDNFHLEHHNQCQYDYLSLSYNNITKKYCGNQITHFSISSNKLQINFVSDVSVSGEGFSLRLYSTPADRYCHSTTEEENGIIYSPGIGVLPRPYICIYLIKVPIGRKVILNITIEGAELNNATGTCFAEARLRIINGNSGGTTIAYLCPQNPQQGLLQSSFNLVSISYMVPKYLSASEFNFVINFASVDEVCGSIHTDNRGEIASPHYPLFAPINTYCVWQLQSKPGKQIRIKITHIRSGSQSETGVCDDRKPVIQFQSLTEEINIVCSNHTDLVYNFDDQIVNIIFNNENNMKYRFRLLYGIRCNLVTDSTHGRLESSNVDARGLICHWEISFLRGSNVTIQFDDFDLPQPVDGICKTYVQITDNTQTIMNETCGESLQTLTYFSKNPPVYIVHYVHYRLPLFIARAHRGIVLEYQVQGCIKNINYDPHLDMNYNNFISGSIESFQYPISVSNVDCLWTFNTISGYSVKFTFDVIHIDHSVNCTEGPILVAWENRIKKGDEVLNVCESVRDGNSVVFQSSSNVVYLKFLSSNHENGGQRKFHGKYEFINKSCEFELRSSSGIIQSPKYPNLYDNNLRCKWDLHVRNSMSIHLKFLDFETENHDCRYDYVKLSSPTYVDLQRQERFCGRLEDISNKTYNSISNEMIVTFHTDQSIQKKGFKARFFEGCGGLRNASVLQKFLLSPNYPYSYSLQDGTCEWTIMGDPGSRIFFYFMGFEGRINPTVNCTAEISSQAPDNSLSIVDGLGEYNAVKKVLCSTTPYHPIISTGPYLRVILKSTNGNAIFKASYGTGSSACGGDFYLDDGLFTSPFYPNLADMEIDCIYIIRNSPGSEIYLNIEEFSRHSETVYLLHDFIEIRSGSNFTSPLYGRFYRYSDIKNATDNIGFSDSIWLRLRSQGGLYTNSIKFLAKYHIRYNDNFQSDEGRLASPQFGHLYNDDTRMTWTINGVTSDSLEISFEQFSVGRLLTTGECDRGVLTISDSVGNSETYCGSNLPLKRIFYSPIQISLVANGYRYPGFVLNWSIPINETHTKTDDCTYVIRATNVEQILTSPNHPNFDQINRACQWTIMVDEGDALEIQMLNFSMEGSTNCKFENLTISFTGHRPPYFYHQLIDKMTCGSPDLSEFSYLNDYYFNSIKINFKVDLYDIFPGFRLSYKKRCFHDYLHIPDGVIQNDEFPNAMSTFKNCTYTLSVYYGKHLRLNVTSISLPPQTNGKCLNGFLEIKTRTASGNFCGSIVPSNLTSLQTNDGFVMIKLFGDFRALSQYFGFQLKFYIESEEECGGNHILSEINDNVVIKSKKNEAYIECLWSVKAPYGKRLKIDFLTMQFNSNCEESYLAIYDGLTTVSPKLGGVNHCSRTNSIFSSGNAIFIKFKVQRRVAYFSLNISIGSCGGTLYRLQGIITSPNYPGDYPKNINCTWNIITLRRSIKIEILDLNLDSECTKSNLTISFSKLGDIVPWNNCNNSDLVLETFNPTVDIFFSTNVQTTKKGFKIKYTTTPFNCGGTYNEPDNELQTPHYPASMPGTAICVWKITVDFTKRITVNIKKLNFQRGLLEITNSKNRNIKSFYRNMENYIIDTSVSAISIEFIKIGSGRLSFSYNSDQPSYCGGYINPDMNDTGIISIPSTNATACYYKIYNFHDQGGTISFKLKGLSAFNCDNYRLRFESNVASQGSPFETIDSLYMCHDPENMNTFVTMGREISFIYAQTSYSNNTNVTIQIQYKYNRCGGVLTEPFGNIQSPGFPEKYPNYANCEWLLKAPENKHIKLLIRTMHLEQHLTCKYDYLFIRYGNTFDSPPFLQYCGQHLIDNKTIIFRNNLLRLSFHSDYSVSKDGFDIEYTFFDEEAGCEGIIYDHDGSIKSPNYPNIYPSNLNCNWTVILPPGFRINVTFSLPFEIELSTNNICLYDYLSIYDSDSVSEIANLCGHDRPTTPIISSRNRMSFVFRTDFNHNLNGFKANFKPICGGIYNDTFGEIKSTTTFISTISKDSCTHLIPSWRNHILVLRVTANLLRCNYNFGYVDIFFENRFGDFYLYRRMCGVVKEIKIVHPYSIKLVYGGNTQNTRKFSFSVIYLHQENIRVYRNITQSTFIKTPQFPSPYYHNARLMWKFFAPEGYYFYIVLNNLDIEGPSPSCYNDYLAIYTSNSTDLSNLYSRLCGYLPDISPFTIPSNILTFEFYSDISHAANHTGFSAIIKPTPGPSLGCGGYINVSQGISGTLSSFDKNNDGLYENNLHCDWFLFTENGNSIKLNFENSSVNMEKQYGNFCSYDYLKIFDGLYAASPLIQTLCGNDQVDQIISKSSNIMISFDSDTSVVGRGFKLTYTSIPSRGYQFHTATEDIQYLSSPSYPNDSPFNFNMFTEMITLNETDHVIIEITDLTIRQSSNCSIDRFIIQDVSLRYRNKIRTICESLTLPLIFISSHDKVIIQYIIGPSETTNFIPQKKFKLNYKIYNCNRTEMAYSGTITNIESLKRGIYNNNLYCNLTLTAPSMGLVYQFYFQRMQLEGSLNCSYDYIQFIYGTSNGPQFSLPRICGHSLPPTLVSNSSQVSMLFVTDSNVSLEGFDITYVVNPDPLLKCGGNINLDSGVITSPGFGHNYYEQGHCVWNIALLSGTRLKWSLTDLELGNSTLNGQACTSDLDFVRIKISNSDLKYCGNEISTFNTIWQTQQMVVEYKSAHGGTGIGFRLEWAQTYISH